ncbi:MAG: hypothetical protein L3J39_10280 [Verrucomicrobiales bacterium]|nr:hypothetical protein [Verrucomicrobiales bacterium]
MPVILAGKGGGKLRAGRHLTAAQSVPMTNLYLSLLDKMGVQQERLGDSSGRFDLGRGFVTSGFTLCYIFTE